MALNSTPMMSLAGVRLEPLAAGHGADLAQVVAEGNLDRTWYTKVPSAEAVPAEIERRLELQRRGTMAPWAIVCEESGRAVGMSTYMNIDADNCRLEIGSTFLAVSAQGTGVNAAAKLMLLSRAFEELDCIAVEFRTHWHNRQSRQAIERLGAKLDGVLRNHQYDPLTGSMRDTVVYSILPGEWPAVRSGLRARLARHGRIEPAH